MVGSPGIEPRIRDYESPVLTDWTTSPKNVSEGRYFLSSPVKGRALATKTHGALGCL